MSAAATLANSAPRAVTSASSSGAILSGARFNAIVLPGSGFPAAASGRVPAAAAPVAVMRSACGRGARGWAPAFGL